MATKITAVIITKDEERNIGRCIASLEGVADEIVVVDSGSTDSTEAICRKAGVHFVHHDWEGYSEQKNYANSLASHPWLLSIDADEALSPTLRQTIAGLKAGDMESNRVYAFRRLNNYCGHWIRHCGWYPDSRVRLWARGKASWDGIIHEELRFDGAVVQTLVDGDLLHYSYYTVAEHVARIARYAPLSAEKDFTRGKRATAADIVLRPAWTFIRTYLIKGGFRDGVMGFTVCRLSANYSLVKYSTLYNMCHEATD